MPSHMPSSFASAAAGSAPSRDSRGSARGETRGSGDWPTARRENRGPNGTLTLRRSSTTPYGAFLQQSGQGDPSTSSSSEAHLGSAPQYYTNQGSESEGRFSKSKLLDIYRTQQNAEGTNGDVTRLFVNNWDPGHPNGTNGRGWGKLSDTRDQGSGPEICWDQNGQVHPIGLEEMSDSERIIFMGDVNSPLKPPPQNTSKDQNTPGSTSGRKTSISHGQGGPGSFGLASPTSTRPGPRRRETSDSITYSSLASPGGTGRFNRDDTSAFFTRKSTEGKDNAYGTSGTEDHPEENAGSGGTSKTALPFGGLMRSSTVGNTLGNGPASPWGSTPASATLAPMGNFGSFAMPGNASQPLATGEKRQGFGSVRGESRLAALMPRESSEELSLRAGDADRGQESSRPWRSRPRTDTDPFGDDPTSSTVPEGGQDLATLLNQYRPRAPGLDIPSRNVSGDLGMSDMPGFRESMQRRDEAQQTPQGHHKSGHEHLSPADTNPYGSPPAGEREEIDLANAEIDAMQHMRGHALGGIPENGPNQHGALPRGFTGATFDGSDRSQNSSAGASKPFTSLSGLSALGGLGALGAWGSSSNQTGTPERERQTYQAPFANSLFGPMGDLQSPSLANIGGPFGGSSTNLPGQNTIGRGSKLGSLFPAAMQAQMQGADNEAPGELGDSRQGTAYGAISRNAIGGQPRETDSPLRAGRGVFDELLQAAESRGQGSFSSAEMSLAQATSATHNPPLYTPATASGSNYQPSQDSSDSTPGSLPQTQQRTMVMPDRMRWVYLDPQGQVQGPWSGLEMHDWYKASFFTADLSVKKVEDAEFEPLGQLIRRIGNSREPFLVPQIGVPHGPVTTQPGGPFAPATATSGAALSQGGSVQPPFAGAFPSFGTTLTAEQQNNLERRKQEEQYLMARQREFLAQQQVNMKQLQMQGGLPAALHHHSSAHSLQSQPSFGSITSPMGIQPQGQLPGAPAVPGFFDAAARQSAGPGVMGPPTDYLREEELARLSMHERQQAYSGTVGATQLPQTQQLPPLLAQQVELQRDAGRIEQNRHSDPQGFKARLREFEQLRAQHDLEQSMLLSSNTAADSAGQAQLRHATHTLPDHGIQEVEEDIGPANNEGLSLTEQVQKAASAKHTPTALPESPWAKVGAGLPMPFPPPQSATPLPAPTALRGRSNLPEALHLGSRSRSETPDIPVTTPSIAPWAKEQVEATKGPSLKEIQEVEARKAAKVEEAAAAARRAMLEQGLRSPQMAPAPGLPTSSTWGNNGSPVTAVSMPSAWAKPVAKAQGSSSAVAASKKPLADIQREEELRKQKIAAASAATAMPGQPGAAGGKRYADLAGKPTATPASGSAWSTVGAGGKVKVPTGPSGTTSSTAARALSSASIPPVANTKQSRPATSATRSLTGGASTGQSGVTAAHQEFTRWARNSLSKGLHPDINVDEFVQMLADFPAEAGVIADSVYANSQLMDGRRFAEEFIRRKKLADKGVIENTPSVGFSTAGESKSSGGWSEVAKKGPPKEEPAAAFKVVPNKKKGRK